VEIVKKLGFEGIIRARLEKQEQKCSKRDQIGKLSNIE